MTDFSGNPMPGASWTARMTRWWKAQTAESRKTLFTRGGLGAVCFGALIFGMPVLSGVNAERLDSEKFRERSVQLAEIVGVEEMVEALDTDSALLSHDWLKSVEYSLERDPASALNQFAAYERDRAAIKSVVSYDVPKRADAEDMLRQKQCLATAIYYEARSEETAGQLAVAEVIVNRVKDHRYPNTSCDVVFQGATRTTGCQFTFTCDGAMKKKPRGERWKKAQTLATHVVMGLNEKKTSGATHYHATYVDPIWNSGLIKTRRIGTHIFYRFPRGGEWSVASARQSERLAQRRAGMQAIVPAEAATTSETSVISTAPTEQNDTDKAVTVADLNAQALEAMKPATEEAPVEAQTVEASADADVAASGASPVEASSAP